MNNEIVDEAKCVTFLEQIRYSMDQDKMFQNTEVTTDITLNTMSLIVKREKLLIIMKLIIL